MRFFFFFLFHGRDVIRYAAIFQCPVAVEDFVVVVLLWASASCWNLWNNFKVKLISELLDIQFTSDLIQDLCSLKRNVTDSCFGENVTFFSQIFLKDVLDQAGWTLSKLVW